MTGIRKDAEEILVYIYKCYTSNPPLPKEEQLLETTKWAKDRLLRALDYLREKKFVVVGTSPSALYDAVAYSLTEEALPSFGTEHNANAASDYQTHTKDLDAPQKKNESLMLYPRR